MKKEEKQKLIKEFEEAHSKYSTQCHGHWRKNWRKAIGKDIDLKDGYWYWKGYRVYNLILSIQNKCQ